MAVMVLGYESSLHPCFVCTPTKWSPERYHNQKELSSPETNLPCTRFLNVWFTLEVVKHQFLVTNTSVLLLQSNSFVSSCTNLRHKNYQRIIKSFLHLVCIMCLESFQCSTLQKQVCCSRTLTTHINSLSSYVNITH